MSPARSASRLTSSMTDGGNVGSKPSALIAATAMVARESRYPGLPGTTTAIVVSVGYSALRHPWQSQHESRPLVRSAFRGELSTHGTRKVAADRQPQTRS